jgi:hypothetical protein
LRVAHLALIVAALFALATFSAIPKEAYSHSMGPLPIRADIPVYRMKPGDTQTQAMRVCSMLPGKLVIDSVTFNGTNSDWASVDKGRFPITVLPAANMTASASIPLSVTIPSNFTGDHAIIQTIVNTTSPLALPVQGSLIVLISNSTVASSSSQNLPGCKSLLEVQRGIQYSAIIVGAIGASLIAVGYFAFRRSKGKSQDNKPRRGAKILLVVLGIIGSFLIVEAILSLRF